MSFDITKHEFSDDSTRVVSCGLKELALGVRVNYNTVQVTHVFNESDVMALARHFNLTNNDIEEK